MIWRTRKLAPPAAALAVLLAACGGGDGSGGAERGERSAAGSAIDRDDIRIAVVSHGQSSDPFWSVVANGVNDAADDLGVRVEYQTPTSFDMVRMSQMIDAVVASRPSALAISIPDPAALRQSIQAAVAAGIPTISINAGPADFAALGLLAHIGQTEYESGVQAGERLAAAGARRVLCVNHEVGNVSLDERCRGLGDAMSRTGGAMTVLAVSLADPDDAQQRISGALARDASADGILALGPGSAAPTLAALKRAGRAGTIPFGTFDLEPGVLAAVRDGQMVFAIDQQPYLQGYLGVSLLVKYLETGTMPGGGEVIRTGPSFVTAETAADVIRLSERGVR